jgi:hypothetical protein
VLAVRRHDHSRYRSLLITLASYGYDFDAPSVTAPHETAKSIIEARGQALLLASSRMAGGETTLSDEEATRRFPVGTETVGCARAQVPGVGTESGTVCARMAPETRNNSLYCWSTRTLH